MIEQRFSAAIAAADKAAMAIINGPLSVIDAISEENTLRILDAFRQHQISEYHFRTSTGYAYSDPGRTKLEEVWATIFQAEKALVRTQFCSGTHAIATALFGVLRPGDKVVSLTGRPYDTLTRVIGYQTATPGSLKDFGIGYEEIPLLENGNVDQGALERVVQPSTRMVMIQRSRGYSLRKALSIAEIGELCAAVHAISPKIICFVDNCYGEFVESCEPTAVGADLIAGSLIKNPGGGLAPTGGYIAGRSDLVSLAGSRLTAPGVGGEIGASLSEPRLLFQGLFLAPHTVAQALRTAIFAAALFENLGFNTYPSALEVRSDIIQSVLLGGPTEMEAFCQGLQKYSPVDAHVRPVPGAMPGYDDPVIMAGGTFVQGSSIELSADGPIRPPYVVYLQGGLTFEHSRIAILSAAYEILQLSTCTGGSTV